MRIIRVVLLLLCCAARASGVRLSGSGTISGDATTGLVSRMVCGEGNGLLGIAAEVATCELGVASCTETVAVGVTVTVVVIVLGVVVAAGVAC